MKYTLYDSVFNAAYNTLESVGLIRDRGKRNFLRSLEDFKTTVLPKILELVYDQHTRKEIKTSYYNNIQHVLVKQTHHFCNRHSLNKESYFYNGHAFACLWMADMMSSNYKYWKSIGLKQVRWNPNTFLIAILKYGYKSNYFSKQDVIDFVAAEDMEKGIRYSDAHYAEMLNSIWEYAKPKENDEQ